MSDSQTPPTPKTQEAVPHIELVTRPVGRLAPPPRPAPPVSGARRRLATHTRRGYGFL